MDGIHEGHRARMKKKLLENGERSLADHELLEVLLYIMPSPGGTPMSWPTGC